MTSQRACVAHCSEPGFCPGDPSSLLLPEPLTNATTDLEMCDGWDDDYDDDDDDDDAGGVPLPSANNDAMMTDENDLPDLIPTVHTAHDSAFSDDTPSQLDLPPGPSYTSSTRGPSVPRPHSRPETRIVGEQEDGRRLPQALEGDGPDAEPQSAFPATMLQGPDQARRVTTSRSVSRQSRAPSQPSTATSRMPSRRASTHDNLTQQSVPINTSVEIDFTRLLVPQPNMEYHFDEDALAVDDPRRNYDFADFMDNWRLRSIKDRRLPRFEPGLQSSIRIGRHTRPMSRHDVALGVDVQGIRWKVIGPSREDAMKARDVLHPSPATVMTDARHAKRHGREGKHYQFRSFNPQHKAKVSHFQLRNTLGAANPNEIFYASGSQVTRTSLACPDLEQTVMDLSQPQSSTASFRVTCLAASSRHSLQNQAVIVAGGFFGEYALCNLDSVDGAVSEGFVTNAYNGLVTHIHTYPNRRSGLPQAAFCSNDRMLRLMDVPSLRFTDEFSYEHAINCASTSPDGRLRVLVGDSQETLITNAETGQALVTLREHGDHGFACDWSPDGIHIATASQDGSVLIWDARNWSKPCRSWGSSTSCARSVQWTDDGALVVAENDDIVRVYDRATSEHYQEINFFGSIAGVALINGGEEMVVANADKTVGGLLSFERTPQGFGEWNSQGRQISEVERGVLPGGAERASRSWADIVV